MSNIKLEDLEEGMKIRLKTKEQLKECGWEEYQNGVMYREDVDWIVSEMLPWLGKEVTVSTVYDPEFEIEEEGYNWYPCMVAEIISNKDATEEFDLHIGDVVKLKTLDQLKRSGWKLKQAPYAFYYTHDNSPLAITEDMLENFIGEEWEVNEVYVDRIANEKRFTIKTEGYQGWEYNHMMIDYVVNHSNKTEQPQEEPVPYFGVEDEKKTPTVWNKESIQRTFEELQMYDKGYVDGFKRAIELMKEKFGVEL